METGGSPVQAYPYCKQGRKIKTIVEELSLIHISEPTRHGA